MSSYQNNTIKCRLNKIEWKLYTYSSISSFCRLILCTYCYLIENAFHIVDCNIISYNISIPLSCRNSKKKVRPPPGKSLTYATDCFTTEIFSKYRSERLNRTFFIMKKKKSGSSYLLRLFIRFGSLTWRSRTRIAPAWCNWRISSTRRRCASPSSTGTPSARSPVRRVPRTCRRTPPSPRSSCQFCRSNTPLCGEQKKKKKKHDNAQLMNISNHYICER